MKEATVSGTLNSEAGSINIGPFSETLQPLTTESLADAKKDKCREGTILTPVLLVWFVLSMILRRDLEYKKILNWLVSGIRWAQTQLPAKLVADGTISHARTKLGFEVFRVLFCKLVASLQPFKPDFHGLRSVIFDGSIPDFLN